MVVSDDELTALALAADPDGPVDPDAVPFATLAGDDRLGLLPDWYLPSPQAGRSLRGWRRAVALLVVVACFAVAGAGLCNTYGVLGPA